jgi:hypothetical protein
MMPLSLKNSSWWLAETLVVNGNVADKDVDDITAAATSALAFSTVIKGHGQRGRISSHAPVPTTSGSGASVFSKRSKPVLACGVAKICVL